MGILRIVKGVFLYLLQGQQFGLQCIPEHSERLLVAKSVDAFNRVQEILVPFHQYSTYHAFVVLLGIDFRSIGPGENAVLKCAVLITLDCLLQAFGCIEMVFLFGRLNCLQDTSELFASDIEGNQVKRKRNHAEEAVLSDSPWVPCCPENSWADNSEIRLWHGIRHKISYENAEIFLPCNNWVQHDFIECQLSLIGLHHDTPLLIQLFQLYVRLDYLAVELHTDQLTCCFYFLLTYIIASLPIFEDLMADRNRSFNAFMINFLVEELQVYVIEVVSSIDGTGNWDSFDEIMRKIYADGLVQQHRWSLTEGIDDLRHLVVTHAFSILFCRFLPNSVLLVQATSVAYLGSSKQPHPLCLTLIFCTHQ